MEERTPDATPTRKDVLSEMLLFLFPEGNESFLDHIQHLVPGEENKQRS